MAYQPETATYDVGVFQLETSTPVQGGVGGASNTPLLNLADRTAYLKQHVDALEASASGNAPVNSPTFTGTPAAPTPASSDSSTKLATTAFVQGLVGGLLTKSVAGGVNVNLTAAEAANAILVFTGAITANIAVVIPANVRPWLVANNTTGAFTLTVQYATGTGVAVTQGKVRPLYGDGTNVYDARTDFVNTAFTGAPTAPTPASGDNSTKLATTAFLFNAIDGLASVSVAGNVDVNLSVVQAGSGIIALTGALTGNINVIVPAGSGQWIFANSTTGAFTLTVKYAAGTGVVVNQGAAASLYGDGTNVKLATQAIQPSGGTMTGALALATGSTTPTPSPGDNSTKVASTAFVAAAVAAAALPVGAVPKAVVVFQGATGTILKSFNVNSVTRNSQGDYTLNIAAGALADAAYGAVFGCDMAGGTNTGVIQGKLGGLKSTTAYEIVAFVNTQTPGVFDPNTVTAVLYD